MSPFVAANVVFEVGASSGRRNHIPFVLKKAVNRGRSHGRWRRIAGAMLVRRRLLRVVFSAVPWRLFINDTKELALVTTDFGVRR